MRRLGGAYGSKVTRNSLISCAAAIAAHKLKKPIKLQMSLITNMNAIGKRFPFSADYEVGVNERGAIQYLNASLYTDLGSEGGNDGIRDKILGVFTNLYKSDTWTVDVYFTKSDNHSGTWCRSPCKNNYQFCFLVNLKTIKIGQNSI